MTMELVTTVSELGSALRDVRAAGRTVALVPTMGALHAGHRALVSRAIERADYAVVSIFVNPLQFGPQEDLTRYPRDLARDTRLLEEAGAHLVFAPAVEEMYPAPPMVRIDPGPIAGRYEGLVRPGHFGGVLTVVAKLFHRVRPDVACFGQKDIQQATLVRRLIRDLDWPIELIVVPTVREADGLALSSRNVFLSPSDRIMARRLSRALGAIEAAWRAGEADARVLRERGEAIFAEPPALAADYLAIVDPERFEPVERAGAGTVVAVAARVGTTRLIDNVILGN
jgi:pantoate--beta-alanine ligase